MKHIYHGGSKPLPSNIFLSSERTAAIFVAAVYAAICIPLECIYALKAGRDPIQILLFQEIPSLVSPLQLTHSTPGVTAFWFSLGVLYAGLILFRLLLLSGRLALIDVSISAYGFFVGYLITMFIAVGYQYLFRHGIISVWQAILKIFYLYLFFVLLQELRDIIGRNVLPESKPLDYFFDGLFGLIAAWFIASSPSHQLSEMVVGPLFLAMSSLAMIFAERIILRSKVAMALAMIRADPFLSRINKYHQTTWFRRSLAISLILFIREVRRPYFDLKKKAEHLLGKELHEEKLGRRIRLFQIDKTVFGVFLLIYLLWPTCFYGLAALIIHATR